MRVAFGRRLSLDEGWVAPPPWTRLGLGSGGRGLFLDEDRLWMRVGWHSIMDAYRGIGPGCCHAVKDHELDEQQQSLIPTHDTCMIMPHLGCINACTLCFITLPQGALNPFPHTLEHAQLALPEHSSVAAATHQHVVLGYINSCAPKLLVGDLEERGVLAHDAKAVVGAIQDVAPVAPCTHTASHILAVPALQQRGRSLHTL
eukprot:1156265-Pelagomonas_calceolata.AAC.6